MWSGQTEAWDSGVYLPVMIGVAVVLGGVIAGVPRMPRAIWIGVALISSQLAVLLATGGGPSEFIVLAVFLFGPLLGGVFAVAAFAGAFLSHLIVGRRTRSAN